MYHIIAVNEEGTIELTSVDWITNFAQLSSGFILAIIRMREPYFLYRIKKSIKNLYGEIHLKDKSDKFDNTYQSFLQSSLTAELVYCIL